VPLVAPRKNGADDGSARPTCWKASGPLDLVVANLPYLPEAQAGLFPELASEPPTAVFADGDGLHPYRRLVSACTTRLRPDGSLVVQFHRRVLAAERSELRELQAALEERAWEETARLAA
jgi:methylase of polypeptide subunit release factors